MEAYEAILTRRSVRAYTRQTVSDSLIKDLLVAAVSAPSAGNQQPWHFVVLTDRERLDALAEVLPYGKMLLDAPLGIVVCADPRLQKYEGYWVQDCCNATENILLAAHAKGLGGVWIGVHPKEDREADVRRVLGMPDHVIPLCSLSIGYPAEATGRVDRYSDERVHRNRW
jgi:nitroreductase